MKQQENKNVLVTGGLGYIGSHTVVKLIENGYKPFIIDNLSNSKYEVINKIKEITGICPFFLQGDLTDEKEKSNLHYILKQYNINYVIHFAAYKSVSESVKEPLKYYENNIKSTITLLEAMKEYNVKNIIFSSSCTVYGEPDKYPVDEKTPLKESKSPYGKTKRICEQIIEDSSKNCDYNSIILRYFNPIGCHESGLIYDNPNGIPENLIPYITGVLEGKYEFLKVFGNDYNTKDGTAIRDYIDVNDLAEAHVKALDVVKNKNFDIFNIGSGDGYSVLEILDAFEKSGNKVNYKIFPKRNGDIEKIYGDIKKSKDIMGWYPKKTLYDTIKSIIKTISK